MVTQKTLNVIIDIAKTMDAIERDRLAVANAMVNCFNNKDIEDPDLLTMRVESRMLLGRVKELITILDDHFNDPNAD